MKVLIYCCFLVGLSVVARAQSQYANWYFGTAAGLRFGPGEPTPLTNGQLTSEAACATLSDAAGNLLLYSNGEQVWNAQHQLLANGDSLGGTQHTPQGCAVLPVPGTGSSQAYLFGMRYGAAVTPFSAGQPWAAELDLAAASGRGRVTRRLLPIVADSVLARLGERLFSPYQALVRHANGVDCWLITRLNVQGVFMASLITRGGGWPCATTVVSRPLPTRAFTGPATWCGGLASAPDGRTLLYNDVSTSYLLAFDPVTGRVGNALPLTLPPPSVAAGGGLYCYGAAFSPDGSKCYLSRTFLTAQTGQPLTQVVQVDAAAGSAAAVSSSGIEISLQTGSFAAPGLPYALQRGANGKIYGAVAGEPALDVINQPNVRGAACQYVQRGQQLAGRLAGRGLPLQPSDANLAVGLALADAYGCAGQPLRLVATGASLGTAGDSLRWTLGPGWAAVRTTAPELTTTYAAPGTYPVTVVLRRNGQALRTATATVYVLAASPVSLGRDTALCAPFAHQLAPRTPVPPSSRLVWSDGSGGPTFTVTQPGTYWLELTNGNGCATRDSITISDACGTAPLLTAIPNIITPASHTANEYFTLAGLRAADWSIQLFNRWGRVVYQQASYDNRWAAADQPAGIYYYLLHNHSTGQRYRGWVEVVK